MEWLFALFVKPFVAMALFTFALVVSLVVKRFMPECKLKRILFFSWRV